MTEGTEYGFYLNKFFTGKYLAEMLHFIIKFLFIVFFYGRSGSVLVMFCCIKILFQNKGEILRNCEIGTWKQTGLVVLSQGLS